jgi:hypothetical protein
MRPLHGLTAFCKSACRHVLAGVPAALFLGTACSAFAQAPVASGPQATQPGAISATYAATAPQPAPLTYAPPMQTSSMFQGTNWNSPTSAVFGGADYLLLRTHFSQAIAFVQVNDSLVNGLPNEAVQAREINFPYSSGFRTYVGYNLTPDAGVQFTYFHFANSTSINATPASVNQYFVDAYTERTTIGQHIVSNSSVALNVFDLDYLGRFNVAGGRLGLRPAAGMRWASVRQHNDTGVIDPLLGPLGSGNFNTTFTGFGPHVSLLAQARHRPQSAFSLMARAGGALLLGPYNNTTGATFPRVASAEQTAHRLLTVPVLEAELGGAWQPTPNLMFSAGWLWQAWFDLGVSGGTNYNGKFAETDSSSIMAFDGLFLRGLWQY